MVRLALVLPPVSQPGTSFLPRWILLMRARGSGLSVDGGGPGASRWVRDTPLLVLIYEGIVSRQPYPPAGCFAP